MEEIISHGLSGNGKKSIEERAVKLAQYIIDTKDTEVTQKNGWRERRILPESIEIKSDVKALPVTDDLFGPKTIRKVFLADKNPIVRLKLVIK